LDGSSALRGAPSAEMGRAMMEVNIEAVERFKETWRQVRP
jgi:hypothetical protein